MSNDELVGLPVAHAYRELIVRLPEVSRVAVVEHAPPPPICERAGVKAEDEVLFARAARLRRSIGVPFWDAVMMIVRDEKLEPERVFRVALFHRSHRGSERWLSRSEVVAGALAALSANVTPGSTVSLLSELHCFAGNVCHLPMLDLRCTSDGANLPIVSAMAQQLLPDGSLVVDSGHSYHIVGCQPVNGEALLEFLGRALLFGALVDRTYVAHQIIERRCALRLSRGGHADREPCVVLRLVADPGTGPSGHRPRRQ